MNKRFISGQAFLKNHLDKDEYEKRKRSMDYIDRLTVEFENLNSKTIDSVDGFKDTGDPEVDKLQVNIIGLYELRINMEQSMSYDDVKDLLVMKKMWEDPY